MAQGSKADLTNRKCDFRCSLESGLKSDVAACPKSAKGGNSSALEAAICYSWRSRYRQVSPNAFSLGRYSLGLPLAVRNRF
jgi:hypothetical protein